MNISLELKVIEQFVVKDKCDRYKQFVSSERSRRKFIQDLSHFKHFNWQLFEKVDSFESNIVQDRIQQLNSTDRISYAISENTEIDGKQLTLEQASMAIGSNLATILVFGEAKLIYFEGEPPFNRFISRIS